MRELEGSEIRGRKIRMFTQGNLLSHGVDLLYIISWKYTMYNAYAN